MLRQHSSSAALTVSKPADVHARAGASRNKRAKLKQAHVSASTLADIFTSVSVFNNTADVDRTVKTVS
jgi:hypothetical protein